YSYLQMLTTPRVAGEKLAEQGLDDERLVWIPTDLFDEARDAADPDEFERQTFERLIRAGLKTEA
ncbi:MAG TPA: hypothetical protein VFP17_03415, partial [Solirubrobacterales bacterium]|nr:hypothetical protein [Solirubrobacterales bacterium]